MKRYLLVGTMIFSSIALADLEHIPGQGEIPSRQKLSLSRGCFDEIDNKGCGRPGDDHEVFIACLDDNRDELSINCQSFIERLYGKRK